MGLVIIAAARRTLPRLLAATAVLVVVQTAGLAAGRRPGSGSDSRHGVERHRRRRRADRPGRSARRATGPRRPAHQHNRHRSGRDLQLHRSPNHGGRGLLRPHRLRRRVLCDGRYSLRRPSGSRDDAHRLRINRPKSRHRPAIRFAAPATPDRRCHHHPRRHRRSRSRRPNVRAHRVDDCATAAEVRRARRRVRPAARERI